MKRNKLGIQIVDGIKNIEGNSIVKNKYTFIKIIFYFRLSTSTNPYISNLYGMRIFKEYKQ